MPELTTRQIRFLAKYLHVVPRESRFKGKQRKHDEALVYNDLVKASFAKYEAEKLKVDALSAEIKQALDQLGEMLGAITPGRGGKPVTTFRTDLAAAKAEFEALDKVVDENHADVMRAPESKPEFGIGAIALKEIFKSLKSLKRKLPTPPDLLDDGILGALYAQRAKIIPLREYRDINLLSYKIVNKDLADSDANDTLKAARDAHRDACREAYSEITYDLINKVLAGSLPLSADQAASETDRILTELKSERKPFLATMMRVIKAAAKEEIGTLADSGNVMATRETQRSDQITATVKKLNKKLAKLQETIDNLHLAQGKATGFKEKQGLTDDYKDAVERLETMQGYIRQIEAYDDSLALRVEQIKRGIEENARGLSLIADPDAYILAANAEITPLDDKYEEVLLGGVSPDGKQVDGIYNNLLAKFSRAANRVSVNVKLFPDEADLKDISASQFDTLKSMLEAANTMAIAGKDLFEDARETSNIPAQAQKVKDASAMFGKAKYMFNETDKLYLVFNAANKFPLPETPPAPQSDKDIIAKQLKTAALELDRFWGIGGDADDAIRTILAHASDAFEAAILLGPVPHDFTATKTLQAQFAKALAAAQKAFTPAPQDVEAKKKAGTARDAMVDGLLALYKTKPRQEAEIGDIPDDHLLVISRNGKTEYHEILTKGEGNEINRRDNKQIPRETINLMLEQAAMLELLAQSTAPDTAKAIEESIAHSTELLEAIQNGDDDFDHIASQIKLCDKLLEEDSFKKWVPASLHSEKTGYETFKEEYPTKYLPAAGRKRVDAYLVKFTALLKESDDVREAYADADAILVQVEKDFANKKGAKPANLETRLAEIIAAGPRMLAGIFSPSAEEETEFATMMARMQKSLTDLKEFGTNPPMAGPYKSRIKTARQTLDTKSADGIAQGRQQAEDIRDEMAADLLKLSPSDGIQYLRDLDIFLKGQASAALEAKELLADMALAKQAAKEKLALASERLKLESMKTMASYKEFKTIYSSLKTQYKTAGSTFKSDEDAKAAISEYKNVLTNATRLERDIRKTPESSDLDDGVVNFGEFQTTLDKYMSSVRHAAKSAADDLKAKAADAEEDGVIAAAKSAGDILKLAAAKEIQALVKIKTTLQALADTAIETPDKATRKKLLANVREKALAEVRRISNDTENHPALKVYRDNPFIKDVSWPALAAHIHALDLQVLRTLDPR